MIHIDSRRVALFLVLCTAVAVWPFDLVGHCLDALAGIPAYLSPTAADNAGNSTAILMASALASLLWLRPAPSTGAPWLVALLGIVAGCGA